MTEEWSSRFNPFNSDKIFSQFYKWEKIKRGKKIPPPTLVSMDLANACDLKCGFCNADYILKKNHKFLSKGTLNQISRFLKSWGTETVCVGGGGESLINPHAGYFIDKCISKGIEVGVVTNGTRIDKHLDDLAKCTWVGVSVDAGTRDTYTSIKGRDKFEQVISNMEKLVKYSKDNNLNLTNEDRSVGVGMKYLIYKHNLHEIYEASKIAKDIGCSNIHIRPSAPPWDKLDHPDYKFSENDLVEFRELITKARALEDENFKVYGITHKFDGKFKVNNDFDECYAIFMNCVIMPPTDDRIGKFNFGLCCDRRGDNALTLENLTSTKQIKDFWGSEKHWEMFDNIKPSLCPRCTYKPHNQAYEKAIKKNSMCYKFI
jgi:MoaA/NifB/PqqE/SkfB family radical SAM enzyme